MSVQPVCRAFISAVASVGLAVCLLVFLAPSASAITWSIQTTPNATGAEHSALYDIDCAREVELGACTAAGKQTASGGTSSPYAQRWNGTSWANQTAVSPEGATAGELQSVSCLVEAAFCYAAGSYTSAGTTKGLTESWNFITLKWTLLTTPNPEGASETALKGISCTPGVVCSAVGYSVNAKTGKKTAVALGMSEGKWTIQKMPEPEGAFSSELHGVDCPSTTYCMAVGSYSLVSGGPQWAMSATWNGTSWTLQTVTKPTEAKGSIFLDVSCMEASECRAVGGYKNSSNVQVSLAERWGGTSWSVQSSANPVGSTNTVFQGVSCLGSTFSCVAVGDWNNGKVWQPMAQSTGFTNWTLDTTPTPAGATFSLLEGVACGVTAASPECLGSGWYTDSGGKNKTLGEERP